MIRAERDDIRSTTKYHQGPCAYRSPNKIGMESLIFIVSLNILSNIPLKTFQRHSEPNQFYSFNQTSSLVTLTLAYFISLTSPECDCCQQSHIRFHTSSVQGKMSCSIIDVPLLTPPPPPLHDRSFSRTISCSADTMDATADGERKSIRAKENVHNALCIDWKHTRP